MCVCVYVCVSVCVHASVCVCVGGCACMCVWVWVGMCVYECVCESVGALATGEMTFQIAENVQHSRGMVCRCAGRNSETATSGSI